MNAKEIYDFLVDSDMTPAGACGMMGNLYAESGLKFNVLERLCIQRYKERGIIYTDESYTAAVDSGAVTREEFLNPMGKRYGYGEAQWTTPERKAGLYDLTKSRGVSIADPQTQMDWLIHELQTSYKPVWNVLINAQTVREASDIVLTKFECPEDQSEAVKQKRAGYGEKYYEMFAKEAQTVGTLKGLIDRAYAEQGYIEKATNASLDSKSTNKGDNNFTKYSRDVNNAGLMGCQGQPWCCTHQFWLEMKEFGVEKALEHWNMTKKTYVGYNCFSTYNAFKAVGKTGKEPRLGAVAIFSFSHAGRVVKIYEKNGKKYWDCEEGNTSSNLSDRNGGQVVVKQREWNDPTVKGFCYIDYESEAKKQPEPIVEGWKLATDGKRWWYQYLDGNYPAGDWAYLQEATEGSWGWYLFDADGYMLTGYQTDPKGRKVFLCPEPSINQGKCMVTDDQGSLKIAEWDEGKSRYVM